MSCRGGGSQLLREKPPTDPLRRPAGGTFASVGENAKLWESAALAPLDFTSREVLWRLVHVPTGQCERFLPKICSSFTLINIHVSHSLYVELFTCLQDLMNKSGRCLLNEKNEAFLMKYLI